MPMKELLDRLHKDARTENATDEVVYLQSQNDNLDFATHITDGEFKNIRSDIPPDITWATEALGRDPDAVNIWVGNHRSATSVHCDPYENIYAVVRGTKIFTLFPPTEGWCLQGTVCFEVQVGCLHRVRTGVSTCSLEPKPRRNAHPDTDISGSSEMVVYPRSNSGPTSYTPDQGRGPRGTSAISARRLVALCSTNTGPDWSCDCGQLLV